MQTVFDSICITRQNLLGPEIDLGFLAQAMIFYREVHIIADKGMLTYLLKTCGPDSLKTAIGEGFSKSRFLKA